MPRQLSIRSDEAYKLAHRLAKQRGQTVTEVATDALRREQGPQAPEPEEAVETLRILLKASERSAKATKPGATSDHSYLYDEHGLPK
jgi:antitoxin VapB